MADQQRGKPFPVRNDAVVSLIERQSRGFQKPLVQLFEPFLQQLLYIDVACCFRREQSLKDVDVVGHQFLEQIRPVRFMAIKRVQQGLQRIRRLTHSRKHQDFRPLFLSQNTRHMLDGIRAFDRSAAEFIDFHFFAC